MWDGHDGMGWWMVWGSILWVVFIVAIVMVTARLSDDGRRADNTRPSPPGDTAGDCAQTVCIRRVEP